MKGGGLKEKLAGLAQQVGAQVAQGAKAASKLVSQEVLGAQCLLDYAVGSQLASAGPGGLWRVYTARSKKEGKRGRACARAGGCAACCLLGATAARAAAVAAAAPTHPCRCCPLQPPPTPWCPPGSWTRRS